ncbi:helix-turn-helix domain-containing protein [Actinoplanes couchii]|uniref:Helix-turn-helix domain-containing protein n=1 Tax=Actinoplanes couchii TaxID=403638 RepID=A0ABQ3XSY1_9ACTN|nr:helix-turn-helix domain-containing protein [Actinoplanes couchii]MDR6324083.1 putative transcriptional regulator [Actinoplanes couchii]GID61609.1 hypothetical protein Aco03nite_100130 [Actinoplanes couchii]
MDHDTATATGEPHRRITPLTATERRQLSATLPNSYRKEASIRALAEKSNRSYGTIHKILEDAGVLFRKPGGQRKPLIENTTATS